jgi:hypothetical protein
MHGMTKPRQILLTVCYGLLLAVFCAAIPCCSESKVVHRHPFLAGLPGSETKGVVTGPAGAYVDPTSVPDGQIVRENPDKSKTLIAKTGRHLMVHIYNTIADDDAKLFVDQVLSEMTKVDYYERGLDPRAAFDTIKARREDVVKLFAAMPAGEYTPGIVAENVDTNVRRVNLTGASAKDLSWTGFDMVMEKGNWRLRWFVGE